jgi:MFS family permease
MMVSMSGAQTASPTSAVVLEPPEQRRTLVTLVVAQVLSGAGLAAGITVGALLAEEMLGSSRLSGLPTALFAIGSAAAAASVGQLSQRFGRRAGLSAGYLLGAAGGFGVVAAARLDSLVLLFLSLFVYGGGIATNLQARYAGADLAAPSKRGRAVSTVLVATTVGAVLGPNLVGVMGTLAEDLGIPPLAGPFLLAGAAYGAAGIVLWAMLRPDPLQLARTIAAAAAESVELPGTIGLPETGPPNSKQQRRSWSPAVASGAGILILTQLVMAAIMTMTPIHIQHHGHHVSATGAVISAHVAAMFLPSPVTGWLVDRYGRVTMAVASAVTLLVAGLLAAWAPPASVVILAVALVLLGVGWNFGLVSGSALITDAVPLERRAQTQGLVDLGVAIAAAGAGIGSGLIVSAASYPTLTVMGGLLALLVIPAAAISRTRPETA